MDGMILILAGTFVVGATAGAGGCLLAVKAGMPGLVRDAINDALTAYAQARGTRELTPQQLLDRRTAEEESTP